MAKKKKSSIKEEEPTEPTTPAEDDTPDVIEDDDDDVQELLQVDVGDIVKLKQVLDESVAGTFLEVLELPEDHRMNNLKLGLMTLACVFAMIAQFAPIPFPESRPVLGVCCCLYFILSSILQLIVTFLDKDAIMITKPLPSDKCTKNKLMSKLGLRIRASLPRFEEFYTVIIEFEGYEKIEGGESPFVKQTWSVGQFFDVDGMFDEIGLMEQVEQVYNRFAQGKYDEPEESVKDAAANKKKD
eukprot:CAMPEP_0178967718 /NCGR_PEP_ID=MMETSP0789-20121207/17784_1 /TAXON_ID=3005 /ORGANISM="Rhizosolenia setigera, Strain CCMP 1694" /LENGTH=241 /DNA_ID=CAMNT_0020653427 /DNA_START=37 /DNA_END=762 /DNA_ORIENTATION=-